MTSIRVPVVVVTYDAPSGLLERCVEALAGVDPGPGVQVEVVVVDNGGRAGDRLTAAGLRDRVARLVEPTDNPGFGAAVNAGAAVSDAAHVVCLNDDVVVRSGWLAPLVAALAEPGVGGVQPLLVQPVSDVEIDDADAGADAGDRRDGGEYHATGDRRGAGDVVNSAGVELDRFGAGSDRARGESADDVAAAGPVSLRAVTGGAAAFSSTFLAEVGGFDERFFLYYEDVDLCQRGTEAGWSFRLVPDARVEHVGSASTGVLGDHRLGLQERNRLWTVARHGSLAQQGRALWLSIRRLRHEPRAVHRRALVSGMRGMPRRWFERVRPGSARLVRSPHSSADPFGRRPLAGVNVVGYHHISSGLGDAARDFSRCLRAAGVDVIDIDNDVSDSPRVRPARPMPDRLHDTTVAFVTAFEFEAFRDRTPELTGPGNRMIGYWFWELSTVPETHVDAMGRLDEVWAATSFVRDAYSSAATRATHPPVVRLAPLQLPQPDVDEAAVARWRTRWGERFVFLVSFDYFSVFERKNPTAAIAAFRSAFPDDDTVRLVVKSMNGDRCPDDAAALEQCSAGDERIEFVDTHLDLDDHHALIAAADCYVSPHRSEGLGLQPALAMWLRTPVIATRYGGVVDFLDDDTALLCDHRPVEVAANGGVYPAGATWADIDHDELVESMRTIRTDPVRRARVIAAAHRRIEQQGSAAEFGRRFVDALTALD